MPELCEQLAAVGAGAGDIDSERNSVQSSEPGVEPKETEPEDCQWGNDLGVTALDEEVNQLLEVEIDSELVVTTSNSTENISIWNHGYYPLHRRHHYMDKRALLYPKSRRSRTVTQPGLGTRGRNSMQDPL